MPYYYIHFFYVYYIEILIIYILINCIKLIQLYTVNFIYMHNELFWRLFCCFLDDVCCLLLLLFCLELYSDIFWTPSCLGSCFEPVMPIKKKKKKEKLFTCRIGKNLSLLTLHGSCVQNIKHVKTGVTFWTSLLKSI